MMVYINGKKEKIEGNMTVQDFLKRKIEKPHAVILEYNGEIIPEEKWDKVSLKENDVLEVLKFVGGG